jgi:hypothetical protein
VRELRGKIDDSPLVFDNAKVQFELKSRNGVAFAGPDWKLPEGMWEPWDMTGHPVTINGVETIIRGVDAFASMRSPSSPYRHGFCILVDYDTAKKLGWEPE